MKTRLNLGAYLDHHHMTAYRLVQQLKGRVAQNTVYNLARTPQQRIDLDTVGDVLSGLSELTGKTVGLVDLLEELPEPQPLEESKHTLEGTGISELRSTLEQLEKDTPPNELDAWLGAFEQARA
jgi:hypothetical protein